MPRPLRIEFPDACYHVICRGNPRSKMARRIGEDRDLRARVETVTTAILDKHKLED